MSKNKETGAPGKVFEYMKAQNRPYSVGDVFLNMHKEFNKPCIQRSLDTLVSEGKVKEKVYGKQKIYSIDQSIFPSVDERELRTMDQTISALKGQVAAAQNECNSKESKIKSLEGSLTIAEAKQQLSLVREECIKLKERLSVIKEGSNKVTPEQSQLIRKKHNESIGNWRKRKRMAIDIVDMVLEGYPKSKKELLEEVGVETDEDCNVLLPMATS